MRQTWPWVKTPASRWPSKKPLKKTTLGLRVVTNPKKVPDKVLTHSHMDPLCFCLTFSLEIHPLRQLVPLVEHHTPHRLARGIKLTAMGQKLFGDVHRSFEGLFNVVYSFHRFLGSQRGFIGFDPNESDLLFWFRKTFKHTENLR